MATCCTSCSTSNGFVACRNETRFGGFFVDLLARGDGARQDVLLQASSWGSDLDSLIELARHGAGVVIAPDFCVTGSGQSPAAAPVSGLSHVLPGWRLIVGLETVQALTLPMPAGSETARALVRYVRESLGWASPA